MMRRLASRGLTLLLVFWGFQNLRAGGVQENRIVSVRQASLLLGDVLRNGRNFGSCGRALTGLSIQDAFGVHTVHAERWPRDQAALSGEIAFVAFRSGTPVPRIYLMRSFFRLDRRAQEFTLLHELVHVLKGWDDRAFWQALRIPEPFNADNTHRITVEMMRGCPNLNPRASPPAPRPQRQPNQVLV